HATTSCTFLIRVAVSSFRSRDGEEHMGAHLPPPRHCRVRACTTQLTPPESFSFHHHLFGYNVVDHGRFSFLCRPSLTLIYPLYASICAMESTSKLDDGQWLAYWIIYSFIALFEMAAEQVLYWIPLWYELKLLFVAWLVLPQFRGASFIYEKFVREQIRKHGVMLHEH
uniref:HVA22-like protein n=1 Tax=Aegilops tauschii subsp. strangulata TaxID=200361 RepID=A0A453KYI5_AEGTS